MSMQNRAHWGDDGYRVLFFFFTFHFERSYKILLQVEAANSKIVLPFFFSLNLNGYFRGTKEETTACHFKETHWSGGRLVWRMVSQVAQTNYTSMAAI